MPRNQHCQKKPYSNKFKHGAIWANMCRHVLTQGLDRLLLYQEQEQKQKQRQTQKSALERFLLIFIMILHSFNHSFIRFVNYIYLFNHHKMYHGIFHFIVVTNCHHYCYCCCCVRLYSKIWIPVSESYSCFHESFHFDLVHESLRQKNQWSIVFFLNFNDFYQFKSS